MITSKHIAYFINQYPAVSHSFIRREILALESLGWRVSRFAIRPARGGVVDAADQAEAEITKFIVKIPLSEFITIIARQLSGNAVRFFRTLVFAFRFMDLMILLWRWCSWPIEFDCMPGRST